MWHHLIMVRCEAILGRAPQYVNLHMDLRAMFQLLNILVPTDIHVCVMELDFRCVAEEDRAVSTAFTGFIASILGTLFCLLDTHHCTLDSYIISPVRCLTLLA